MQEWFDMHGYAINVTKDEIGIEVFEIGIEVFEAAYFFAEEAFGLCLGSISTLGLAERGWKRPRFGFYELERYSILNHLGRFVEFGR